MDQQLLESIKQFQEKLNTTSGNLEKQRILKKYATKEIQQLLGIILNTNVNFNVTSKQILKIENKPSQKQYTLFELLTSLESKQISGHNAVHAVQNYIKQYPEYKTNILNIIDKKLKIGMNVKQINKVFPNLIPTFSVALAEKFEEKHKINNKWFISRKLDGVRCICIIKNNNDIKFYSRVGKEFLTLDNVKQEIQRLNLKNIVFDGEIAIVKNNKEDFKAVTQEFRKKDHTIKHPKYFIFDVLRLEEFEKQKSARKFSTRLEEAPVLSNDLVILEYLAQYPYSEDKFSQLQKDVEEFGWEGLMLRKDAPYQGKRSKDILKVKKFQDDEFLVTEIETNTMRQYDSTINNYREVETLGAVVIDYKGFKVSVGSGFTMEERNEIYQHPEKIIGKLITVNYFEETKDKKGNLSLRFPTFKTIVGTRRDI